MDEEGWRLTDFMISKIGILQFALLILVYALCSGSFPDKKIVEEDNINSSFEGSDRIKLVRLVPSLSFKE